MTSGTLQQPSIASVAAKLPRIVELVGPAGVGKSSLSRLLVDRDDKLVHDTKLRLRGGKHIPLFVGRALQLLPTLALGRGTGRFYSWEELKKIVYLRCGSQLVARSRGPRTKTVIVDQGPVFELATLWAFGPERLRLPSYDRWWDLMFRQWAASIDMMICLDADDDVLIPRILERDVWHVVKDSTDSEARAFLSKYRDAYEHVISRLTAVGDVSVVRFDTSTASLEVVMNRLAAVLPIDRYR
jgi:adenylate kinase family enzyme